MLQKCKLPPGKCKAVQWKYILDPDTINMQRKKQEECQMKSETKRRIGRIIAWFMIVLLVLIVIPIGAVMFVMSGLVSGIDRILRRFNSW